MNGDEGALEFAKECDEVNETVGLSVVSVEEYLRGVYHLYWESGEVLKKKLASAERDLSTFEILPITREIAVKAAEVDANLIKMGETLSLADALIAATAINHNLVLLTRGIEHFKKIPKMKIKSY
ncbi:PIN domain-containing protein [Candidatus Bathyarchaeota archaeon]|nr:PIN domain-containing protein [Candidatus Bathyarchaeota archaeon]